jgi:ubiquinone/menaquinone biosynthesis C-methylase UbiE
MTQIVFDEKLSKQLESNYSLRDFKRRRDLVHEALAVQPGEHILDVGCGPGFYVAELADRVGGQGSVVGVDISAEMLVLARRRCEALTNVSWQEAAATSLPLDSRSFDAAISVQVLEFVKDVDAALAELRRVLRPHGRVVIWDVDWSSLSWYSDHPERMVHVLRVWGGHLSHPSLPQTLGARLRAAGFGDVEVAAHAFIAAEFTNESYGVAVGPAIQRYAAGKDGITPEEAEAWWAEQGELGKRGQFFFACTQFCFTARCR